MDKSGVRKELNKFVTDFKKIGPFVYMKTEVTQSFAFTPLWPFNNNISIQLCIVGK